MKTKVARWGNSLAVRLPAEAVRTLGLAEGQVLEVRAEKPRLELTAPTTRRYVNGIPVYEPDELFRQMRPENEPELLDWGPDLGSEVIDGEYSPGGRLFRRD